MTVVRAPGKLMIAGEYAVLDGAPAIVLAVDRGVQCTIHDSETLEIETPNGDDRFVRPALVGRLGHFLFSAWNPTHLPEKPGFGGSAAACVAACCAAGRPATDALAIHRAVQGGGSGADVLASIAGGMSLIANEKATALPPVQPVVIWSGKAAKTQPRVDHYLATPHRQSFIEASQQIVEHFTDDPVRMLGENADLLMHMAVETGLPYMTPRLAAIRTLARSFGGTAKPSGAGGGDCSVALFPDPDAEDAFRVEAQKRGLVIIDVNVAGPAG